MQRPLHINGFTLVEALVAMVVLAVGMLAVARMFAGSIHLSGRARLLTDAGVTAQTLTETIRSGCTAVNGDSTAGPLLLRWTGGSGMVQSIQVVVRSPSADSQRTDIVTAYEICDP